MKRKFYFKNKKTIFLFLLSTLFSSNSPIFVAAAVPTLPKTNPFRIYVYDSLLSTSGLGPLLKQEFEKRCHSPLEWISVGDSGQFLSRLKLDSQHAYFEADAVLGIDQIQRKNIEKWIDPKIQWRNFKAKINPLLWMGNTFLPFDYGVYTPIVNEKRLRELNLSAPESIFDLIKPQWHKKFILQDPRTSGPGFNFLLHVKKVIPDLNQRRDFYKKLRNQWLVLAPGWDEAYGLFLKNAAPMVWSYLSSEAYHRVESRKKGELHTPYRAATLDGMGIVQVEGFVVLQGGNKSASTCFGGILLSKEVQKNIPTKNWMFPATTEFKEVNLKSLEDFKELLFPKILEFPEIAESEWKQLLLEWEQSVSGE